MSKLLGESAAYGLPRIFKSERIILKLFWTGFFILGSIFSVFFVIKNINNYFEYDVTTKIETKYEQPSPFPTISFCPIINNKAKENPFKDKSKIKKIITECAFGQDNSCGTDFDNFFESFENPYLGMCFRFNSGKNMSGHSIPILKSTIGGRDGSLRIFFNPIEIDYFVWIHDPLSPPVFDMYNNYESNTNLIKTSEYNYLSIQRTVEKKLDSPYNPCFKDADQFPLKKELIDYFHSLNQTYRYTNCLQLCFELSYLKENPCNCTNASLGNVWHDCWRDKEKETQGSCTWNFKAKFLKESVVEKCHDYCPLKCDSVSYSVSQKVVSNKYRNYQSFFFYESLEYILISQIPVYDIYGLISNIGGSLSIFIGLSFVSLFEIIEIFIEFFFLFFENNKLKKTIVVQTEEDKRIAIRF